MKRRRKSTWLPLALLVYVTVMAIYLLPRNTQISTREKCLTLAGSYLIVLLLWLVLRKKEQMQQRRMDEWERRKGEQ